MTTDGLRPAAMDRATVPEHSPAEVAQASVGALLDAAIGRCALVCAPGGYGKTTQVRAWVANRARSIAWIDVERCDNDPTVLLAALADALRSVTDIDGDALALAERWTNRPAADVASMLGRAVARAVEPFILVLDGVDMIHERASLDLLASLAEHLPSWSTLVLIGRGEPGLPLARLRARDDLVQIGAAELALDAPEANALLQSLGVDLDDEDVARLVAATEGWAVGIRTAGLAIRRAGDADAEAIADAIGHEQAVVDYVRQEWLSGISTADVDFLERVSCLDLLDGESCDFVLDRHDSGHRLEHVSRICPGVLPVTDRPGHYRMHVLLREVLDQRFDGSRRHERRRLGLRASEWFERSGDIDRAVHHAVRAGDVDRAERLVYSCAAGYHARGRHTTVMRWLSSFSTERVLSSPRLCLISSITSLGLGRDEDAATWTRCGIAALSWDSDAGSMVAHQLAVTGGMLSTVAVEPSLADVTSAYDALPTGTWHAAACEVLGALHFSIGNRALARAFLHEGATEAHVVGAVTVEAVCRAHLAVIHFEAGDRQNGCAAAREARRLVRAHQLEEVPTLILVTAVSAFAEAIDGELELARADLALTRRHMPFVRAVGSWANVQARIALARTSLMLSDPTGARILLDETREYLRRQPDATHAEAQVSALATKMRITRSTLPAGVLSLTPAELRVLNLLPTHLTIADIAEHLFVSRNTAKAHAAAVYRKLGVASRGQAVRAARAAGLLDDVTSS